MTTGTYYYNPDSEEPPQQLPQLPQRATTQVRRNPTILPAVLRQTPKPSVTASRPKTEVLHDEDVWLPNLSTKNKKKASLLRQVDRREDDTNESEGQSDQDKLKDASANMRGPNIQFKETFDKFMNDDPADLQTRHAPPFMPHLSSNKVAPLIEWERQRTTQQLEMSNDPYLLWLEKVAGGCNMRTEDLMARTVTSDTSNHDALGFDVERDFTAQDIWQTTFPSSYSTRPASGSVLNLVDRPVNPANPLSMILSHDPVVREAGKDIIERTAQRQATRWLERPNVIGNIKLSERAFQAMELGVTLIHSWCSDTPLATVTAAQLIEGDPDVNTMFATLVSLNIGEARTLFPTKQVLDSTLERIMMSRNMILNKFQTCIIDDEGVVRPNHKRVRTSTTTERILSAVLPGSIRSLPPQARRNTVPFKKVKGFFVPPT